jgi:D-psicose/D-tagatose/L-ribulose 3-epimerase
MIESKTSKPSLRIGVIGSGFIIKDCHLPAYRKNGITPVAIASRTRANAEEVAKLDNLAIHVHISDCDGKVHGDLPPGRGVVKFAPYLQAIKELGIDGAVTIELEYSPDPERIVEWVEEAYTETARLMQQVDLRG